MKEEKKLKIVLFTGYSCNNNCAFCIDADKRGLPQKSTAELLRETARARNKGAYILEIIGGEATIRPDFCRVVAAAKKLGIPQVSCATNGRRPPHSPLGHRRPDIFRARARGEAA